MNTEQEYIDYCESCGCDPGASWIAASLMNDAAKRIKELETEVARLRHDQKETMTKVIPGLIKFAREGRLEEYLTALKLRLEGVI